MGRRSRMFGRGPRRSAINFLLGYDPGTYEVTLPNPLLDATQIMADLETMDVFSEQGLASVEAGFLTKGIFDADQAAAASRLLAVLGVMASDTVRFPLAVAAWNQLGQEGR
jgi:hypothetical protein